MSMFVCYDYTATTVIYQYLHMLSQHDALPIFLSSVEAFAVLIVEILNSLPGLHRWRAIVLSLSGLPKKIPVKCGETKLFPRWEWTIYRMVHARWTEGNLLRLPIFSDFGIDAAGFEPSRPARPSAQLRSEEHTSELQSLMPISY